MKRLLAQARTGTGNRHPQLHRSVTYVGYGNFGSEPIALPGHGGAHRGLISGLSPRREVIFSELRCDTARSALATPGVAGVARRAAIRSAPETPSLRPRSRTGTTCSPTRSVSTAKLSWVPPALVSMVIATVTETSRTINPTMTSISMPLIWVPDLQYTPYRRGCQQC